MGSSFSVLNDTKSDIYVCHGICHAALFGSLAGVFAVITAGAAGLGIAAGTGAAAGGTATIVGLSGTALNSISTISGLLAAANGITGACLSPEEKRIKSLEREIKNHLSPYTKIGPGEKYTAKGSLSLVLTAYVVYDDFRTASCNCFTGPTDGSENVYKVTEYF